MGRKSTGSVVEKTTRRGTSYGIRFRALGERQFVHVGYGDEGASRADAERELAFVLELVRRGEWRPMIEPDVPAQAPTFHEFASEWLAAKTPTLKSSTIDGYRWELVNHLLPHFARLRVDQITVAKVDAYRDAKVREGKLGATSINGTITRLGQILDVAHERELIASNPVRVNPRNRKLKASRPSRPWLEPWQVTLLLDTAGAMDREETTRALPMRRPLLATLAWAGLRVGELIDLRWRSVDLAMGTITVERSKTAAGEREVDIQPELRDELLAWRARTPWSGRDSPVFPTATGGRQNRQNVRQRAVLRVVERTNACLDAEGKDPLPEGLSPHALRRSFMSWLLVEGEDVAYVQQQSGHRDPAMTLGVYARAVRTGRTSARSRRRLDALHAEAAVDSTGEVMGRGPA